MGLGKGYEARVDLGLGPRPILAISLSQTGLLTLTFHPLIECYSYVIPHSAVLIKLRD
jgi:hypothetical protein